MKDRSARVGRAFTLLDVLVSMAVIVLLIGLMLPALGATRESARRVVCRSNVRQIGLGMLMYADANAEFLPPSVYAHPFGTRKEPAPEEMMHLRVPPSEMPGLDAWDGVGLLYSDGYLPAPGVFYCPSYFGEHTFEASAQKWLTEPGAIVGNYHYREFGTKPKRLSQIPEGSALLTDGLRTRDDYSHLDGANVLFSDFSVAWFGDSTGEFADALASGETTVGPDKVKAAWKKLDPHK